MPRPPPADDPAAQWLLRATGKLALARQPLPPGAFLEDLCFFAQKAAELAIKAVFLSCGLRFAFTHDLGRLLDELKTQGVRIPHSVQAAEELTIYAAETRYPGPFAPVSAKEQQRTLKTAEAVLAWARRISREPRPGNPPK